MSRLTGSVDVKPQPCLFPICLPPIFFCWRCSCLCILFVSRFACFFVLVVSLSLSLSHTIQRPCCALSFDSVNLVSARQRNNHLGLSPFHPPGFHSIIEDNN